MKIKILRLGRENNNLKKYIKECMGLWDSQGRNTSNMFLFETKECKIAAVSLKRSTHALFNLVSPRQLHTCTF